MFARTSKKLRDNGVSAFFLDPIFQKRTRGQNHTGNQTTGSIDAQAKSVMDAIKPTVLRLSDMPNDEHEGRKIEQLLKSSDYTVAQLARAAGVSWPAAKKWVAASQLGAEARESASRGLRELGLDPRVLWPMASSETIVELKTLLSELDEATLVSIRKILHASRGDQVRLVDYIDGKIDEYQKSRKLPATKNRT